MCNFLLLSTLFFLFLTILLPLTFVAANFRKDASRWVQHFRRRKLCCRCMGEDDNIGAAKNYLKAALFPSPLLASATQSPPRLISFLILPKYSSNMKATAAIFLAIIALAATTVTAKPTRRGAPEDEFPGPKMSNGCRLITNKYNSSSSSNVATTRAALHSKTLGIPFSLLTPLNHTLGLCCPDRGCSGWQITNDPTFPLTRRGAPEDEFPGPKMNNGCRLVTNKYNSFKQQCCDDKGCTAWQDSWDPVFATDTTESFPWSEPDGNNCVKHKNELDSRTKLCCPDRGWSGWQNTNDPTFPLPNA
ncbi:hypothetical protein DFS34DRAFT_687753 [Phlyctochytrium arcticum]|nr:hypothetical protein DFS34DRAFT_687753 [Phlyctochytrium arcticum]